MRKAPQASSRTPSSGVRSTQRLTGRFTTGRRHSPRKPSAPRRTSEGSSKLVARRNLPEWTFLTNHAHVLITLALFEDLVLREIAEKVGITERAVQKIIVELSSEGYLKRVRVGRRNRYRLHLNQALRHPLEKHRTIGDIIDLVRRQ